MRCLPFSIPDADSLGIPAEVQALTAKKRGLVLVTGPTGSGKSTTLASLVEIMNRKYPYHIITLEDPIEYLHRHQYSMVNQREIGSDSNDYAQALRAALREDPDVIWWARCEIWRRIHGVNCGRDGASCLIDTAYHRCRQDH